MAHIKAGGVTKGNRDSVAKRLGIKIYGGQKVNKGAIIARQRGTKFHPGQNAKRGGDDSILAKISGIVNFKTRLGKKVIEVLPA
ncbi:MAG: 50S ribosomal protein L27 [Patescibacteria group bacterium]|nr:50S ribosomal protein L27 [Patescibacteria group bacterium]